MQAAATSTHISSRPATAQSRTAQPAPSQMRPTQKGRREKSHQLIATRILLTTWQKSCTRKKYSTKPLKIPNTLSLAQIPIQQTVYLSSQQMGRAFSCSRNSSDDKSVGNTQSRYPESESWCRSWKFWRVSWAGSRVLMALSSRRRRLSIFVNACGPPSDSTSMGLVWIHSARSLSDTWKSVTCLRGTCTQNWTRKTKYPKNCAQ